MINIIGWRTSCLLFYKEWSITFYTLFQLVLDSHRWVPLPAVGFPANSVGEETQEEVTPPSYLMEHPPVAVFVNGELYVCFLDFSLLRLYCSFCYGLCWLWFAYKLQVADFTSSWFVSVTSLLNVKPHIFMIELPMSGDSDCELFAYAIPWKICDLNFVVSFT